MGKVDWILSKTYGVIIESRSNLIGFIDRKKMNKVWLNCRNITQVVISFCLIIPKFSSDKLFKIYIFKYVFSNLEFYEKIFVSKPSLA